jgi:hypothetical protein
MHKYVALAALVIALNIIMLTLSVSASLTPANAAAISCGGRYFHSGGSWPICLCLGRCRVDAGHDYAIAVAGARPAIETKRQACEAKCVNASEAAQR